MNASAPNTRTIALFGRKFRMPASRLGRIVLGVMLVLLGFLGFLPVLGFWMIPLGLFVLSHDLAPGRRFRRRLAVWWTRRKTGAAARPARRKDA